MKNLIIRTISGILMVWLMLEATASQNVWYYVLWVGVAVMSLGEVFVLLFKNKITNKAVWAIGATLYIALAATVLCMLKPHWEFVVMLLTIVWSNDVGAYLVGMSIGKHKMAPKISPKKSWEGFFGGLFFAVLVALLWWWLYFSPRDLFGDSTSVSIFGWTLMGLVIAIGSVLGDLLESYFKRKLSVKDSSKLIPGHGGFLDRFDALFMAVPLFWLCLWILNIISF